MTAPRPLYHLACSECGQPFTARRRDARTCSSTCRKRRFDTVRRQQARDADILAVFRRLAASPNYATTAAAAPAAAPAIASLLETAQALVDIRRGMTK